MLQFARHAHRGGGPGGACGEAGSRRASGAPSLTIGEIAEIEGLTPQYAGKLIRILRMGGLLESVRGRHGGYRLAQGADRISVGEVLAVLGGRVFEPAYCSRYTGDRKLCVHSVDCAIRSLWGALQEMMDGILSRIFLKDLMGQEEGVAKLLRSVAGADDQPDAGAFPPQPPRGGGETGGGEFPALLEVAVAPAASPRAVPSRAKARKQTQPPGLPPPAPPRGRPATGTHEK